MNIVKATIIGNVDGLYIDHTTNTCLLYSDNLDELFGMDIESIKDGINHIVARRDDDGKLELIQVCGYNSEDGLFTILTKGETK